MSRRAIYLPALIVLGATVIAMAGCNLNREPPPPTSTRTPRPTFTPASTATPPPTPLPTETPEPSPTRRPPHETNTPTATIPPSPTPPPPPPTNTPRPRPTRTPAPTAAPLRGADWDFEAGFADWRCPYGDLNIGGGVGVGWQALNPANPDQPENRWHSHFSENKDPTSVHSGQRSQRISFEQVACEAYLFRTIGTAPEHTYRVEAWGQYKASQSNPILYIGLDPTGGVDPKAGTVIWAVFSGSGGDTWLQGIAKTQATGKAMTIFLRASRAVVKTLEYGDTFFDDVSVWDEG